MLWIILIAAALFAVWTPYATAYELGGVNIHGFISQGYANSSDNNFFADTKDGTFEFNEIGINFSNKFTDKLRAGIQFFARDLGELGNNEIKADWAYADYRLKNWFGLRFGLMKAPHGLYNETRDIDAVRTWVFLPQSVYQETLRDATLSLQGIGVYGNIDLNVVGAVNYQAMYGTQNIDKNERLAEALIGFYTNVIDNEDISVDSKYAGNLVWKTPIIGLRFGVSYSNVKMDLLGRWNTTVIPGVIEEGDTVTMDYQKYENWVLSVEYVWNDLTLMAEYNYIDKDYETEVTGPLKDTSDGWYVGGAYRFTDWFEFGGYYSETDNNYEPGGVKPVYPDHYNYLKDTCLTTRFDINEYWIFKLEYHIFDGAYGLSTWDNPPSALFVRDQFEKDWTMFAAKLTVSF